MMDNINISMQITKSCKARKYITTVLGSKYLNDSTDVFACYIVYASNNIKCRQQINCYSLPAWKLVNAMRGSGNSKLPEGEKDYSLDAQEFSYRAKGLQFLFNGHVIQYKIIQRYLAQSNC